MREELCERKIKDSLARICSTADFLPLVFFSECESTNDEARKYARLTEGEGVFVAARQSAGRGRRGRSFLSPEGGIYLSILRRGAGELSPAKITAVAAVRAASVIERYLGLSVDIKWVNDLYYNGKKLAGILTEGEFDENGKLRYYVVGMGINVYKNDDFCREMPIATTLEDALGKSVDINELCASLIDAILSDEGGGGAALEEYRERCITLGQRVLVKSLAEEYEAEAVRVLEDYSLEVRLPDGETRRVFSGEVERLRPLR